MAYRKEMVNLDAMILRSDFATQSDLEQTYTQSDTISLSAFMPGSLIVPNLRKPDFQRETNHWAPAQVLSLLQCYVNGDLIPSVILWKSSMYVFVIDGCHRLSVLRAWVEDDYGDGPLSYDFFNKNIPSVQKRNADKTRKLINNNIGSFKHVQSLLSSIRLSDEDRRRYGAIISRALPIQWVNGSADKAEASFFKINTEGTPLDDVEELLLKTRHKPISISARAIMRAGTGHKYWSAFSGVVSGEIEMRSRTIHQLLFEPDISTPVKTLDLPIGGSRGIRVALKTLIDFIIIAARNQQGLPKAIYDQSDDTEGNETILVLKKIMELVSRMTGNKNGSLGLHPIVYFYGPSGQHQAPMFMGTALLIKKKLLNNDSAFFMRLSLCRSRLEKILIEQKSTISAIIQGYVSRYRVEKYADFLEALINHLEIKDGISSEDMIILGGLKGKVFVGSSAVEGRDFSEETKSEAFIRKALDSAVKCSICGGYLDPSKSISYDHVLRKRENGSGDTENCDLTHPYCNQSVKN